MSRACKRTSQETEVAPEIGERRSERVTRRYTKVAKRRALPQSHAWPTNGRRGTKTHRVPGTGNRKDPGFARAYVQLAVSYRWLGGVHIWPVCPRPPEKQRGGNKSSRTGCQSWRSARRTGKQPMVGDWDRAMAPRREFQRGIELNASSAHGEYGLFLANRAHAGGSREHGDIEIDPRSPDTLGRCRLHPLDNRRL
jgi:hypothetical protein